MKSHFRTSYPGILQRNRDSIIFSIQSHTSTNSIGIIDTYENSFGIRPEIAEGLSKVSKEQMWLVVNKIPENIYQVCQGDILKFGRSILRVLEINLNPVSENFKLENLLHEQNSVLGDRESKNSIFSCRICLSELWTEENPLLSPCKCNGTVKCIHLQCLQQLISSKATKTISGCSLFISHNKRIKCEICMAIFPRSIELNNTHIELINIPKPPGMYIVFENLKKHEEDKKEYYVEFFGKRDTILVGRGADCGLRILNLCVSREHAEISHTEGTVWLRDCGSKFGTLVQIKRPLMIEKDKELPVQIGKSLIVFTVKKPWSIIPRCFLRKTKSHEVFKSRMKSLKGDMITYNIGISISAKEISDVKGNRHQNLMVSEGDGDSQVFLYRRKNRAVDDESKSGSEEGK